MCIGRKFAVAFLTIRKPFEIPRGQLELRRGSETGQQQQEK
jgi:hypothetical protein